MKTTKKAWNWFGLKKVETKTSLLNEQGHDLMELKQNMLESSGTTLFDVLETKVYSIPISTKVKKALIDGSSMKKFEEILLLEKQYIR